MRALDVLEYLSEAAHGVALTELAQSLNLSASTTHRLLKCLELRGYVVQDAGSRRYRLGLKAADLWRKFTDGLDLSVVAAPHLMKLRDKHNETVNLAVLERGVVVNLLRLTSSRPVRPRGAPTETANAHASASGKVLLASLSQEQLMEFLTSRGIARFTEHTIHTYQGVLRELARVRRQGFALDREEVWEGVCCIGAPVRNCRGDVVAAVSLVVPKERFHDDRVAVLTHDLCAAAREISQALGYREIEAPPERLVPVDDSARRHHLAPDNGLIIESIGSAGGDKETDSRSEP